MKFLVNSNSKKHESNLDLILASGFFDEDYYKQNSGSDKNGRELVRHYLTWGESNYMRPSELFDPKYYLASNADVEASGSSPLLHYVMHGYAENRKPNEDSENEKLDIRSSAITKGLFNSKYYASQFLEKPKGDLFDHYIRYGEKEGYYPSKLFAPKFYLDINEDVAKAKASALIHYLTSGESEGRLKSAISSIAIDNITNLDKTRSTIVVVIHETSMTGAPILGLNIINNLKKALSYNIISISWRGGGPLSASASSVSDVHIEPIGNRHYSEIELKHIVEQICSLISVKYCIANSSVVKQIALLFEKQNVPVVALVHEFSSLIGGDQVTKDYFKTVSEIVFPAEIVRESTLKDHEDLRYRKSHIITQGRSVLTGLGLNISRRDRPFGNDYLAPAVLKMLKESNNTIVAGLGTLEWRKGIDVFISCASNLIKRSHTKNVKFVWIGEYHEGSYEASLYAEEQINRSGMDGNILFLPPTSNIERIYSLIDIFLMLPRLDPFPNVAIDAMCEGIPTVTCSGGTGVAEFLSKNELLSQIVVNYLDDNSAAKVIEKLIIDPEFRESVSKTIKIKALEEFDMVSYVLKIDKIINRNNYIAKDPSSKSNDMVFNKHQTKSNSWLKNMLQL